MPSAPLAPHLQTPSALSYFYQESHSRGSWLVARGSLGQLTKYIYLVSSRSWLVDQLSWPNSQTWAPPALEERSSQRSAFSPPTEKSLPTRSCRGTESFTVPILDGAYGTSATATATTPEVRGQTVEHPNHLPSISASHPDSQGQKIVRSPWEVTKAWNPYDTMRNTSPRMCPRIWNIISNHAA